jgi:hypothetical protein
MNAFDFELVGTRVRIQCSDRPTFDLLWSAYGHLASDGDSPDLIYTVGESEPGVFRIQKEGRRAQEPAETISGRGWLLALLDDDLVVSLQHLHPELYFLHAAVLTRNELAFLFPAPAGSGKSTLAWALLKHGFEYVSDELAPLALESLKVVPFPRPLCLKQEPPSGYEITTPTLTTERAIHISASDLPVAPTSKGLPVGGIFFPRYHPEHAESVPQRVSTARATTRIYVNCLNALAHPASGLAAAESLATRLPCFELATANLDEACRGVCQVVDELIPMRTVVRSTRSDGDASSDPPENAP